MSRLVMMVTATIAVMAGSAALAQQMLWVTADELNRRSCPDATCPIVGRLYFQESAQIHERHGEWSRITAYYIDTGCALSGRADHVQEGSHACLAKHGYQADGRFAEWVHSAYLSARRPDDKPQPIMPAELMDPRIQGIPRAGYLGTTERDELILRKGALIMLNTGRCDRIESGDQSMARPGYYYVYCDGDQSHYFTAEDVE